MVHVLHSEKKGRRESSFVVVFGILGMIHQRDNTHWLLTGTIKWEGDWVREGGGGGESSKAQCFSSVDV